jgi:predicted ThiF/HesA family dinucleotide-utilizing enzyme
VSAGKTAKVLLTEVELVEVDRFNLEDIQTLVGGYVEATFGDGWAAMYNEDGGPLGYPPNVHAANLMTALGAFRPYVGSVVFIGVEDGDTVNVPQHIVDKAKEIGILDVEAYEDYTGE